MNGGFGFIVCSEAMTKKFFNIVMGREKFQVRMRWIFMNSFIDLCTEEFESVLLQKS